MPRLYHTKSRTGCSRCRSRRVKCDEGRPACGSCNRHQVECIYDRSANLPTQNGHSAQAQKPIRGVNHSHPNNPSSDQVGSDLDRESRERRIRELHLLHVFITEVCPTLPGTYLDAVAKTWVNDVPTIAMEYEPLLHSVMAVTILFISTTRRALPAGPGLGDLRMRRAQYLESTLQEHRKAIGTINKNNADPAGFTSVILSFDAFASLRERVLEPYEAPTQWLYMSKGVMNVFKVGRTLVHGNPDAKINIITETSASFVDPAVIFRESNRTRFPYLLKESPDISLEDMEAYSSTLNYLGAIMAARDEGDTMRMVARRIVVFPYMFPDRFVELLGAHQPRALIIMAHFFAILSMCSEIWWVGQTPRREVLGIARYLGAEWEALLAWPLDMINQNTHSPADHET